VAVAPHPEMTWNMLKRLTLLGHEAFSILLRPVSC
jgi:hypothetical protein